MKKQSTKLGFTLIELLVVIAIIAILAAILFPVFAKVREKARESTCVSNMKQIGLAVLQYTQDNDETFPLRNYTQWSSQPWDYTVQPHIKSINVFFCPDDSSAGKVTGPNNAWMGVGISYASNSVMTTSTWPPVFVGIMGYPADAGVLTFGSATLAALNKPAEDIMVAETHCDDVLKAGNTDGNTSRWGTCAGIEGNWPTWSCGAPSATLQRAPQQSNGGSEDAFGQGALNGTVSKKHGDKRANFLFADGHVKSMKPYQTWTSTVNMWDVSH